MTVMRAFLKVIFHIKVDLFFRVAKNSLVWNQLHPVTKDKQQQ